MKRKEFVVKVYDNYSPDEEGYPTGAYATEDAAIIVCKNIIDKFLHECIATKPTLWPDRLYSEYKIGGPDPLVLKLNDLEFARKGSKFHSWDYAKERCRELCSKRFTKMFKSLRAASKKDVKRTQKIKKLVAKELAGKEVDYNGISKEYVKRCLIEPKPRIFLSNSAAKLELCWIVFYSQPKQSYVITYSEHDKTFKLGMFTSALSEKVGVLLGHDGSFIEMLEAM